MNDHAELIKRLRDAAFQAEDDKTGKDTPESKLLRDAIAALENDQNDLRNRNADTLRELPTKWRKDAEGCRRDGYTDAATVKDSCAYELDAAIAALEAGRSADWVLVPREMTPAMWKAWEQSHMVSESYQEDYAAMLAAAPQQPPPAGQASPVGVTDAARALVGKLEAIHANASYQGVWVLAAMHGTPYRGPDCRAELTALKAALSRQQPDPDEAALQAKADGAFNEYLRGD